ncbi:MAG TPA: hypothetical protein VKA46_38620 [Gemmataceae bacterium]|nr:hypothetical protein [Gemmataceae bacterium]
MRALRLTLDFACCHCGGPVSVTVECSGKGLEGPERLVASVSIPCPNCQRLFQLYFDPGGTVHAVEPYRFPQQTPEPSLN